MVEAPARPRDPSAAERLLRSAGAEQLSARQRLTCPTFITTAEFLPQHREQRQQTLQIINSAEARGHQRVVEMNQQILSNLDAIITTLTDNHGDTAGEVNVDAG